MIQTSFNRRQLLKTGALATTAIGVPQLVPASVFGNEAPSNRINVGCIGTGNQGNPILRGFLGNSDAQVVAVEYVTIYRPHRGSRQTARQTELKPVPGGYQLTAQLSDGHMLALMPSDDSTTLRARDLSTKGDMLVERYRVDGSTIGTLRVAQ